MIQSEQSKRAGQKADATVHRSFRLPRRTAERLKGRARETGEAQAGLAIRYLEEGMRMDAHPHIVFRDGAAGRRPALAGTRLDVWKVIETLKGVGNSISETVSLLDLPEEKVRACISYYAAFQDEIDAWTRRMREIAEREEAAWRREQEVLA